MGLSLNFRIPSLGESASALPFGGALFRGSQIPRVRSQFFGAGYGGAAGLEVREHYNGPRRSQRTNLLCLVGLHPPSARPSRFTERC